MLNYIIQGILISIIVAYVIDYLMIVQQIKMFIFKLINGKNIPFKNYSIKPFDCPLCLTFWIILILGITTTTTSFVYILFVSITCSFISSISGILINNIFNYLYRIINKIK